MSGARALWLAWGAVVALLAYPAGAQFLGDQRAILGGEGFFRPLGSAGSFTLDAMPYTRTVSCDADGYQILGTYTGALPTWSASPSGASGSCTDIGQLSCQIDVDPDATGEGVEVITITNGSQSENVTIGFYVAGSHSCFLAQNIDGNYNVSLANLDPVTEWLNGGSSALEVTEANAAQKPAFRTGIVGGQPVVRFDSAGNGDRLTASTALDWAFFTDSGDFTVDMVYTGSADATSVVAATQEIIFYQTSRGISFNHRGTTTNAISHAWSNSTDYNGLFATSDTVPQSKFSLAQFVHDDDGGAGADYFWYVNGSASGSITVPGAYSALAPAFPLRIGRNNGFEGSPSYNYNGDMFAILIYQSALTSTQRGINKAVTEWALGGTLPVTP